MSLSQFCTAENLVWENRYAKGFHANVSGEEIHTIMRYQIPFSPDAEKIFMMKYGVEPAARKGFYQNLARCVQQQIKTAMILADSKVPSVLQIYHVEQERTSEGITNIYLETDRIWPIKEKLLKDKIDRTAAITIVARLSIILRDIAKGPHSISHRGLDIDEIFVNTEDRIILGGFYYASSPGLPAAPPYLAGKPNNLSPTHLRGEKGDAADDIRTLSCIAWNLFSGVPMEAQLPEYLNVFPQYATEDLANALLFGRCAKAGDSVQFRKLISDCRKRIAKDDERSVYIPIRSQNCKHFKIQFV